VLFFVYDCFALTLYLKETSHLWLAITLTYVDAFWYFGRNVTDKVSNQKTLYTVPPQIACASALPCKTRKHKNHIFHSNAVSVHCQNSTRHRASTSMYWANTSMYSLTFCVRVMLPELHQWKPAVQAAAVMLRTSPIDGQSPASQSCPLPIYGAQFWERTPSPASHRPAARAHPAERSHYRGMDASL